MNNPNDLILRAAAHDVINTWGRQENEYVRIILLRNDISAIPAIDAAPVVHARWVASEIPEEKYVCSNCGGACWYYDYQAVVAKSRYCPNCGAKMNS